MKKVLPKIIPPGKIQKTIDMIAGKNDLILMADGKLVTKGLRNEIKKIFVFILTVLSTNKKCGNSTN